MNCHDLQDDKLIELLFTQEDRLPRTAADEIIKRGERMISPLTDIVRHNFYWNGDDENWWAVIHATFILGAIGSAETVLPLLKALRHAAAYDCDWVTEDIASIFGKVGSNAVEGLKKIALDDTSDWYVRAIAIDGLAAITFTCTETEKEIFNFLYSIFINESVEREVRGSAANVFLDFRKEAFKEALYNYARTEEEMSAKDENYSADLTVEDIDYFFSKPAEELRHYTREWLSFYDDKEIINRQEQRKKEEEEERKQQTAERASLMPKIGRNSPCPCGSGKKYKKCCGMEH